MSARVDLVDVPKRRLGGCPEKSPINTTINRALAERLGAPGDATASNLQTSGWEDEAGLPGGAYGASAFDGGSRSGEVAGSIARVLSVFGAAAATEDVNMVGTMNAAATEATGSINRALRSAGMGDAFFFSDVSGSWVFDDRNNADRTGNEVFGTFGVGYNTSENLTIGVSGSFDWADRPLAAQIGDQEIWGFAINPFLAYRWNDVVFSVNGGYGRQDNEVRVDEIPGLNADFDSDNYNVAGSVMGTLRKGSVWITPRGTLSYNWAEADGFTDGFGLASGSDSEEYGELAGSLRVAWDGNEIGDNGTRFMPFVEPSVYYAFKRPNSYTLAAGGNYRTESLTADIEGGFDFLMKNGLKVGVAAAYRGINQNDIDRVTLRGELSWRW